MSEIEKKGPLDIKEEKCLSVTGAAFFTSLYKMSSWYIAVMMTCLNQASFSLMKFYLIRYSFPFLMYKFF